MKRIRKNEYDILNALKDKGFTRKEIAKELGISNRTMSSYNPFFQGKYLNKNARTPPDEIIKKIRSYARKKRVRVTYTTDEPEITKNKDLWLNISLKLYANFHDGQGYIFISKYNEYYPINIDEIEKYGLKELATIKAEEVVKRFKGTSQAIYKNLRYVLATNNPFS